MSGRKNVDRGPIMGTQLRIASYEKLMQLQKQRLDRRENSVLADIFSQAIDELYEREIGQAIKEDNEPHK